MNELGFLGIALVNLIAARPRVSPNHWFYFPEAAPRLNRAHEPKNFDAAMAPPERSLVCSEITCRGDDENWRASDDALLEIVARELEAAHILVRAAIVGGFVHRVAHGYPLYSLGYRPRLEAALDFAAQFANLATFGRQGLFCHNNLDHSIVMGLRAAQAALSASPARAMREHYAEFRRFRIVD